jgi:hypothetical protein
MAGGSNQGSYVADISNAEETKAVIEWTISDIDDIVSVRSVLGSWIRFSRNEYSTDAVSISYDPPADGAPFILGPSQNKVFDGKPLSARSQGFQQMAIDWFGQIVLSRYLRQRKFLIDPTSEITKVSNSLFGQRLPTTIEELANLIAKYPAALQYIRVSDKSFKPEQLSTGARRVIRSLLEDQPNLKQYLSEPGSFIKAQAEGLIQDEEAKALVTLANEQPDLVRYSFNVVEIGGADGDGNTYILIGIDPDKNLPSPEGLQWLQKGIDGFVNANGFLPSFGWYLTEAQTCRRVIAGPGVSDRDISYLQFMGHDITDQRQSGSLNELQFKPAPHPGEAP